MYTVSLPGAGSSIAVKSSVSHRLSILLNRNCVFALFSVLQKDENGGNHRRKYVTTKIAESRKIHMPFSCHFFIGCLRT